MGIKRVMIVGASALQVPMIKKAKDLGYYVGVVDYNKNAVGIQYADEYYNTSTIDPEGVCAATEKFNASGITTVGTDMPMRSIAFTCEQLGLIGINQDTAINSTDKGRMIEKFKEHSIPHPWFYIVKDKDFSLIKGQLTYPCVCKPIDNSASRGVVIVRNEDDLQKSIEYSSDNSRSGDVIIEELLIGSEISVEAFAVHGKINVLAITDKITTGSPFFVEMGHHQPSKFVGEEKEAIIDATIGAMKAVGIENGPAHVEMMITQNGPKLIELGARLGGDYITTDLVPLSTGIDMLGETIHLACGESVNLTPKFEMASAIRYMKTDYGKITGVQNIEEANAISGIIRVEMLKSVGAVATRITNSIDRIGYAIAQAKTVAQAEMLCYKALDTVKVIIK